MGRDNHALEIKVVLQVFACDGGGELENTFYAYNNKIKNKIDLPIAQLMFFKLISVNLLVKQLG